MSINRIQKRLNIETSKKAVNLDGFIKINLESSRTLIPTNEINKIVNVDEQFNKERQKTPFYRIIGTINPLISNPLFNLNDDKMVDKFTWAGFNTFDFLDATYPHDNDNSDDGDFIFPTAIGTFLKENDGWFGYYEPDLTKPKLCSFFDMEPKRERFSFLPDNNPFVSNTIVEKVKNWELTITYPKLSDKTHNMVKGGLLIVDVLPATVGSKNMVAFGLPCLHNLNIGDTVRITGTSGYNGDFTIVRLGLDNGDLQPYYFVIDLPNTGSISANSRMKKIVNGLESEYYFRKFRKIKTKNSPVIETNDYETYEAAFSQNIFSDVITQFVFNEDIDVSDLTDNLNRPLSELYLTIIKTDSNDLFTNISSGIEAPFISNLNSSDKNTYLRDLPIINKIHNGGNLPFPSHTPLEINVTINDNNNGPSNNDFYGDLVEYTNATLNETVLAVVSHRFNTINRETKATLKYNDKLGSTTTKTIDLGPRQEGYFYQPHHLIKIRDFSNYIEEGDINTVDLPKYAINLGDNRYLWRDLLDIGINESDEKSLNYPFLNGAHYMYQNYVFNLRRQDQFGVWGLYYSNFPADPLGKRITDKFITIKTEDDC